MRVSRLLAVAVAAVGTAFVVAGCGGDDETTTTSTTEAGAAATSEVTLTDDQFVEQANAICAEGNKATDQAAKQVFTGEKPTDEQLGQFADILVASIQGQVDAIRALTPPEDIAEDVTTFLDDAESALDEVEADPSVLAVSEAGPFEDVSAQASALGLDECAN